jgi:hypothetical protein
MDINNQPQNLAGLLIELLADPAMKPELDALNFTYLLETYGVVYSTDKKSFIDNDDPDNGIDICKVVKAFGIASATTETRDRLYQLIASKCVDSDVDIGFDLLNIGTEPTSEIISSENVVEFENGNDGRIIGLNDPEEKEKTIEMATPISVGITTNVSAISPVLDSEGILTPIDDKENKTDDKNEIEVKDKMTMKEDKSTPRVAQTESSEPQSKTKGDMDLPADDGFDWTKDSISKPKIGITLTKALTGFVIAAGIAAGVVAGVTYLPSSCGRKATPVAYKASQESTTENVHDDASGLEQSLAVVVAEDIVSPDISDVAIDVPVVAKTNAPVVKGESVTCYTAEEKAKANAKLAESQKALTGLKAQYANLETQLNTLVAASTSEAAQAAAQSAVDAKQAESLLKSIYGLRANLEQTQKELELTQVLYEEASKQYQNTLTCADGKVSAVKPESQKVTELEQKTASLTKELAISEKAYRTALAEVSNVYGAYLDQLLGNVVLASESRYLAIKSALSTGDNDAVVDLVVKYIDGVDGSADGNGNIIVPVTPGCNKDLSCTEARQNLYNAMTGIVGRKDSETQAKFVEATADMCTKNINPKDAYMRFKIVK